MPKPIQPIQPCVRDVEFRAIDPVDGAVNDGYTLEGHAAVFDTPTRIDSWEGTFDERISPGAFTKTLSERKPILQYDHGHDSRVGSTPIGAFQDLREDSEGLYLKARLFKNDLVEPVRQALEAGALTGASFRFKVVRDVWTDKDNKPVASQDLARLLYSPGDRGPLQRTLKEVQLLECGPVAFGAYPSAALSVRSDDDKAALVAEYQRTMSTTDDAAAASETDDNDAATEDDGFIHPFEDGNCTVCDTGAEDDARAAKPDMAKAKEPYGAVAYADPGFQADKKKRYPVDTKSHVLSALSYIDNPADAAKYSTDDLARVKANIAVAAAKFGIKTSAKTEKNTASVDDAATRGTSSTGGPEDAALSGTSTSDPNNNTRATPDVPVTRKAETPVKTKAELLARLDAIVARFNEINVEFRDAVLDDNVQAEYDTLKTERTSLEASVKAIEDRQAELKAVAVETPRSTERGSDTGAPAFHRSQDNIYDIDAIRSAASGNEDFSSRLRDNAMRAVEKAKFARSTSREAAQEQVQNLLDNVDNEAGDLAKRMLATGSPVYERAFGKALKSCSLAGLTAEEQRALSTTAADGGYAVPFQLDPTVILTNAGTINPLRQIARQEQIVGKQWQGVTSSGVTVTRSAEAAEATDGSFTIAQPVVSTNRVTGFVPFTYEIDLEWNQLRSEITRMLADAKEREEATSFTVGDGTGVNANGVVTTLSGNTVTTAVASTFAAVDLYSLETALAPRYRLGGNAKFLANKSLYQAVRQFDTAGGAQLWERIGAGMPSQLLGYDSYEVSDMASSLVTGGAKVALLGDFSNFLIVDRIGMNVELIPQIFGPSGFPTGQRGVFAIWMNNSKILNDAAFKLLVIHA